MQIRRAKLKPNSVYTVTLPDNITDTLEILGASTLATIQVSGNVLTVTTTNSSEPETSRFIVRFGNRVFAVDIYLNSNSNLPFNIDLS